MIKKIEVEFVCFDLFYFPKDTKPILLLFFFLVSLQSDQ